MGMSSWDEDALFADWGWEKDLIQRRFWSPDGHYLEFDSVFALSSGGADGEQQLTDLVKEYGRKNDAERAS